MRRDSSVKVLVLTGEGSAFCAGGNVKDMRERGGIFAGSPYQVRNSYRDTMSGSAGPAIGSPGRAYPDRGRRSPPAGGSAAGRHDLTGTAPLRLSSL